MIGLLEGLLRAYPEALYTIGALAVLAGIVLYYEYIGAFVLRRVLRRRDRYVCAAFEGLIFERAGIVDDVSPVFCDIAETSRNGLVGRPLRSVIRGLNFGVRDLPGQYDLVLPGGHSRPVDVVWRDLADPDSHVIAVRDLPIEQAAQHHLRETGLYDPMFGPASRVSFEHQLQRMLALSDRATIGVAVLCVDLDGVTQAAGLIGPEIAGKSVGEAFARLRQCVRDTDTVARIGPASFAIIQPLADRPGDAGALADRIVRGMQAPFDSDGRTVTLSARVGVALYPADGGSAVALIRAAEQALRDAPRDHDAGWRYCNPEMSAADDRRRGLERDLLVALQEWQFALAYQPFFRTDTLELAGYEALLRWDHPVRGPVAPEEFLPVAEQCGLIVPIGVRVLEMACAEAMTWPQPVTLAVNLSPMQIARPGLVSAVADVLRKTGLPPRRLELEITEAPLNDGALNTLHVLTEITALGVRIALEDFGAGCSSLNALRTFPCHRIKIDRGIVGCLGDGGAMQPFGERPGRVGVTGDAQATGNSDAQAAVRAIVAIGHSLNLDVTAQGVETPHQLNLLKAIDCGCAQGSLLGRPEAVALRADTAAFRGEPAVFTMSRPA